MTKWDDLRFVLAVSRGGGIAAAGRALGVNHSTVSRRITAIETRIGARLFDRLSSGMAATDAGRDAIAVAEEMETSATALSRRIAGQDGRPGGRVTLTAPPMILIGPFMQILAGFSARYPEIDIRLLASNELLNIHRRKADVAIRATDAPEESLFGVKLTEMRAAVYVAPEYLAGLTQDRSRAALDWIGFSGPDQVPEEVMSVYPRARFSLGMDDKLPMLAAAKAGLGAVRLPCFHGDTDPGLVRLPGLGLSRYPDKWMLTHPDLRHVERVRLVMRFAADAIRKRRGLFMGEQI